MAPHHKHIHTCTHMSLSVQVTGEAEAKGLWGKCVKVTWSPGFLVIPAQAGQDITEVWTSPGAWWGQ